jgi:uncharacterized membrane protein
MRPLLPVSDLAAAMQVAVARWKQKEAFLMGLLAAGLSIAGLHPASHRQADMALAFGLVPVSTWAGQLVVVAIAVVLLIGFLFWSQRAGSASFFRGVLAGMGFVLSVDIVLIHWIFGLHHITNTQMDVVLEPLFVVLGLVFLWFAITRERRGAGA